MQAGLSYRKDFPIPQVYIDRIRSIPSHVPVKDLSPPIYMMNYLTVSSVLRIIVIIYNDNYC
jgi:hypothetical protein